MTTPAFTALRNRYKTAKITLLTTPVAKPLFERDPRIDEVIAFDWPVKGDELAHRDAVTELGESLRYRKFDLVVDLRGDDVTSSITKYTSAPFRLGFRSLGCGFLHGFRYNLCAKSPNKSVHRVELARAILEPLGIPVTEPVKVYISDEDRAWARQFLTDNRAADHPILIIHPAAKDSNKCWPVEDFACVAMCAVENGIQVIVVGTDNENEPNRLLDIGAGRFISAVGRTNSRQLAALIESSNVFLGNDSGPMHLAYAVGTPVVAMFLTTDPNRFHPLGEKHKVFGGSATPDKVWSAVSKRVPERLHDESIAI